MVIDLSAVITSTRRSGPMMSPERERRVTVASRTRMESGKATGASWCEKSSCRALWSHPVGEILSAWGRSDSVIAVPVAPIECMHWKERRKDIEALEVVDLVLTIELPVYQDARRSASVP